MLFINILLQKFIDEGRQRIAANDEKEPQKRTCKRILCHKKFKKYGNKIMRIAFTHDFEQFK